MAEYKWEQYIFKPEDFEGAGQYIVRESINKKQRPDIYNTSYLCTVMMKLCWSNKIRNGQGLYRYFFIDMSDGMATEGYFTNTDYNDGNRNNRRPIEEWIWNDFSGDTGHESKQKICEYLNNNPHGETYRFATNEELIRVAAYSKFRTK